MLKFIIAACQVAVETENDSRSTAYLNRRQGGGEILHYACRISIKEKVTWIY
jgi:hypothetical protein